MIIQNETFESPTLIQSYIDICETGFHSQVKNAIDTLLCNTNLKFIMLAGPTCAGKTTTANILCNAFTRVGKNLRTISIDDFFYDTNHINRASANFSDEIDYDSPQALDLEYFEKCAVNIINEKCAYIPKFDFNVGKRIGYTGFEPSDNDIIVFEGIQAIYPEVTAHLPAGHSEKIFIDITDGLLVHGISFEKTELRLIRRIVRDYRFRSASPEFTLYLWDSVRRNEEKNIYPYVDGDCVKIDSLLGYEMNMIKNQFLEITENTDRNSEYFTRIQKTREKLSRIPGIGIEYLPENSVYREFLR